MHPIIACHVFFAWEDENDSDAQRVLIGSRDKNVDINQASRFGQWHMSFVWC